MMCISLLGLALKDTNQQKDKNLWKGLNKLGNILKDVRVALKHLIC